VWLATNGRIWLPARRLAGRMTCRGAGRARTDARHGYIAPDESDPPASSRARWTAFQPKELRARADVTDWCCSWTWTRGDLRGLPRGAGSPRFPSMPGTARRFWVPRRNRSSAGRCGPGGWSPDYQLRLVRPPGPGHGRAARARAARVDGPRELANRSRISITTPPSVQREAARLLTLEAEACPAGHPA